MADIVLKKLKETLRTIELEMDRLSKEAEGFRHVISYYEQHGEAEENATRDNAPKELRNSIMQILREEGCALHYKEIYERLRKRGIVVRGKDPARNIIAHMSQDDRFENVGRGTWGLVTSQSKAQSLTVSSSFRREQALAPAPFIRAKELAFLEEELVEEQPEEPAEEEFDGFAFSGRPEDLPF